MGVDLSAQAVAFLWTVVLGAALGVLYDWFRIGRILKKKWAFTVFLEDLLFSLLAAVATAYCFTFTNHGQVRLFLLAGELLGFVIYHNTVGVLVTAQARFLARFLAFCGKKARKFMNFLKKPFIFLKRWYTMKMYHFKERKALREKRIQSNPKRRKSKKGKADESRGTGHFGGCLNLRCRKHARNLHQAAASDPGEKGRTQ